MRPDAALRPTYPLRTERLLLRPPTPDDVAAIARYKSQEERVRFVPHPPLDEAAVLERLGRTQAELDAPGQVLGLVVIEHRTGTIIGDVVLMWHSYEHAAGEIGYIFDTAAAGRGFATEAARELLRLGFDELGLHRIVGRIDARNHASARVLERLGMRREAHFLKNEWFKGEWTDEVVYALLEEEWSAQRPAPAAERDGGRGAGQVSGSP